MFFKIRCYLVASLVPTDTRCTFGINRKPGSHSRHRGGRTRHPAVALLCPQVPHNPSFSAEVYEKDGLFCTEISDGEERNVDFPL